MAALTQLTSTVVWIRTILYLIGRMMRDRMTRQLVPGLRTTVEALQRAGAATETAIGVVTDARSAIDAADADLDEQVDAFESVLLRSVGKNRQDLRYKKLFPKGLVGATRTNLVDQVRAARRIEEGIARDLGDVPFAVEALPKIAAAREELERQQAVFQASLDDLARVRADERTARMEASAQYRIMYGELVKLYPHNLRKVRGFFRQDRAVKDEEEEAGTTPTAVTPPVPASPPTPVSTGPTPTPPVTPS
ncbi:MAG: hypothetical protein JXB32_25460 [Deltaproteobacteria bacterium]|nr:hypothetical protein [Deltaproteobacteria bacterium]